MPDLRAKLAKQGLELIEPEIASGGSAIVHRCAVTEQRKELPPIGTAVAVKEYRQDLLRIPGQIDRVRQEAKLGREIVNPHLVRCFALLEDEADSGERDLYLVLEWIVGLPLDKWYAAQTGVV